MATKNNASRPGVSDSNGQNLLGALAEEMASTPMVEPPEPPLPPFEPVPIPPRKRSLATNVNPAEQYSAPEFTEAHVDRSASAIDFDQAICSQDCRYLFEIRMASGATIRRCRVGDEELQHNGVNVVPITCHTYDPWSDEEIAMRETRRQQAEARHRNPESGDAP